MIAKLRKYRLHFNFKYIRSYGPFQKWAFGWSFLCFLLYRPGEIVYRSIIVNRVDIVNHPSTIFDFVGHTNQELLYESVPYDFIFDDITAYTDELFEYNQVRIIHEGVPRKL